MATRKDTAVFILDQLGHAERFSVKPMFGEYALYADGKPVAFICDDQLFVKILPESAALENKCERAPAYPGSKDYYLVPEELIIGDDKLSELLIRIGGVVPFPKSRKKAKRGKG
jgi:TfoX/Sxy family transcriptional regulator of competence genes